VVGFFCSEVEPLPWVEPELLFFCLECEETFARLVVRLGRVRLLFSLVPEVQKHEFRGILHRVIPSIEHL